MNRRRSRSRRSRSPRGRQHGQQRNERSSQEQQQPVGAVPPAWPYGGYNAGGYGAPGYPGALPGGYPPPYWDYGAQLDEKRREMAGDKEGDKKRKKKKKKRQASSSSSSSSSSTSSGDWRQKVWNRGWQGNMNMWPQMPGGAMPGDPMAGGHMPGGHMAGNHMWQWPGPPNMGGPPPAWPPPPVPMESHSSHSSNFNSGSKGWEDTEHEEVPPENVPIFLEPAVEEFVPVPKALLGKVIGKQAQTIIEIREKSGAFKVDARDQTSDPCQVKVAGTAEAVKKARALIMEMVESTKNKHAGSDFVEIPRAKIGMVIGLKGSQVNEIQGQTGTKIDVDFESDPCKCYIKGQPDNVERAKRVLLTIAMQIEDDNSEYVDLPKSTSGALIGAQGSRVREFQEQSGARIDVDKTGPRCRVRLTGTREQVANAKQLILAEVENALPGLNKPPPLAIGGPSPAIQPMVIPSHQPTSFPATLSESIARAKAAAEAVKSGLITSSAPGSTSPGSLAFAAQANEFAHVDSFRSWV